MRTRMSRGIVAVALAVIIGVGVTSPTQAAAEPETRADVAQVQVIAVDWVGLVVGVVTSALFGGSSGDIDAAVRQIVNAVESAKTDILNHIDAIAAAEVKACVRSHTIEFTDIDSFSPSVLQLWAQEATRCAGLATAYLDAVQSQQATDNIGFLIGEIYAIAIAGRAKARLINGINLLVDDQIRSYETVVRKLAPVCTERRVTERDHLGRPFITEIQYNCVAYNGDSAFGMEVWRRGILVGGRPLNRSAVDAAATRNTSRAVAQQALPRLRTVDTTL